MYLAHTSPLQSRDIAIAVRCLQQLSGNAIDYLRDQDALALSSAGWKAAQPLPHGSELF